MIGFINDTGTNCYANTVLMSMFCFDDSPFYCLLKKTWKFEDKHIEEKKQIQHVLESIIKDVTNGKTSCTNFIRVLDDFYSKHVSGSDRMLYTMSDANEFYNRICNVFNIEHITLKTRRQSKITKDSNIVSEKIIKQNMPFISIINTGRDINGFKSFIEPRWIDLGPEECNWKRDDKEKPMYRYTRVSIDNIQSKGCIVFYINRVTYSQHTARKTTNAVDMPLYIRINKEKHIRAAVILHLGGYIHGGHYITIFHNGSRYTLYDDLKTDNTSNTVDGLREPFIETEIGKNGCMYFYYKL